MDCEPGRLGCEGCTQGCDARREPGAALAIALAVVFTAVLAALLVFAFRRAHAAPAPAGTPRLVSAHAAAPDAIRLRFSAALANAAPGNFHVTEARAPDVPLEIRAVERGPGNRVVLRLAAPVSSREHYQLQVLDPPLARDLRPSAFALLIGVFLSSALISNFVFSRYLGLCIFFGVSKRRDTSLGMGATFTAVMVVNAMVAWAIDRFVLRPLQLPFLQVLVFIGTVAFLVQFLDIVLRKTHASLHRRFGIYLVLITTNCIILAVPLLNAGAGSGALESFALAVGSGLGFALALFLMSCAREKMELARVPKSFEGLPIAFALAGLFALAFMGFSGLDFFR